MEQLQVKLEKHITEYSYSQASKLHHMEKHLSEQINTVRKDHFHADRRFRQLVDGIREVLFSTGQHVGKLTDTLTAHNTYLEKAVDYFHVSKENHRNIAQYYKQMIGPLDKLEVDMNYVVRTLKDHYPIPQPEDQAESWDPPFESSSSYVPVAASSQDAQLTHMIEIIQAHTKNISTRLEAFNDGLVSSINRYDHSIQDATLRIEVVILQLKNTLKKSPLFSQESSTSKL